MVREVITVNVGRCGIQMGHRIWRQYCAEAAISKDGSCASTSDDNSFQTFFHQTEAGIFQARNLMVDTEEIIIENIRKSAFSAIYNDECSVQGNESANNNFAKAYYRMGPEMIEKVNDRLRKLVDNGDNVQGFVVNHSVGGGTGSGLGALILERIAVDYRRKTQIGVEVFSSPMMSDCVVEPYNALLATHWLSDQSEISVVLDNQALYGICREKLNIPKYRLTYRSLNEVIAKAVSSMTASLRFEGKLNVGLNEFQTNLVPFPRLHFMITSMAPISTEKTKTPEPNNVLPITGQVYEAQNFFAKIPDFDPELDKYLAISINYRGSVKAKFVSYSVQWTKTNKKVSFVEWVPTGFKVESNEIPAAQLEDDEMAQFKKNVAMIGNNTAVYRFFRERFIKKYDMMYSQGAFVHCYVGEGMEEGEFAEAREDLRFLEKDYLDVLSEPATELAGSDEEFM